MIRAFTCFHFFTFFYKILHTKKRHLNRCLLTKNYFTYEGIMPHLSDKNKSYLSID
nr:MAG TPA: hypothetical protein [Caudoviricetes sp.]DAV74931.1 MAG TPA: hypothetical protein [Caudoviricetes sp.]